VCKRIRFVRGVWGCLSSTERVTGPIESCTPLALTDSAPVSTPTPMATAAPAGDDDDGECVPPGSSYFVTRNTKIKGCEGYYGGRC